MAEPCHLTGDFGLRFYMMRGTAHGPRYVLDVLATGGEIEALWTDDRESAHRFEPRAVAEMLRDSIMAAEHEAGRFSPIALIPEA